MIFPVVVVHASALLEIRGSAAIYHSSWHALRCICECSAADYLLSIWSGKPLI